jgi:hypothetical protein
MIKYLFFILIQFGVSIYSVNAQLLKHVTIVYTEQEVAEQSLINVRKVQCTEISTANSFLQFSPSCNFKCSPPKGAIFCRMEDAIYNRLNFWIKFRMGMDDRYSN